MMSYYNHDRTKPYKLVVKTVDGTKEFHNVTHFHLWHDRTLDITLSDGGKTKRLAITIEDWYSVEVLNERTS